MTADTPALPAAASPLAAFAGAAIVRAGWHLIPLPRGSKAPPPAGWTDRPGLGLEQALQHEAACGNLAVALEESKVGALDIEAAGAELFADIPRPECYEVGTPSGGSHVYAPRPWLVSWLARIGGESFTSGVLHVWRSPGGELKPSGKKDAGDVHLFEVRLGPGLYCLTEGSRLPNGRYERRGGDPIHLNPWPEELLARVEELLRDAHGLDEPGSNGRAKMKLPLDELRTLEQCCAHVHEAAAGGRQHALFTASACAAVHCAHEGWRREDAVAALTEAGFERADLALARGEEKFSRAEVLRTIHRVFADSTALREAEEWRALLAREEQERAARPQPVVQVSSDGLGIHSTPASASDRQPSEGPATHGGNAQEAKSQSTEPPRDARSRPGPSFQWFAPEQLPERDPADDIVRDLLAPGELAAIAGPSGAGKTFVALELAVCVAGDRERFLCGALYQGLPVQRHGPVLYFCAEGFSGMKRRIRAADPDGKASARLRLCPSVPMLPDAPSVQAALDSAREVISKDLRGEAPLLLVLDTFAQAVAGADENDNGAMGSAVRMLQLFARALGCAVLLVHHAKKNRQAGESSLRGASSLLCALDAAWGIEPQEQEGPAKPVLLVTEKQKDREGGGAWKILLEEAGGTLRVGAVERVFQVERELVDGQKDKARARLRRDAILRVLHGERHGLPSRAIRERLIKRELAASPDAIARALDALRAAGLVELIGRPGSRQARYRLTPKGAHIVLDRLEGDGYPREDDQEASSSSAGARAEETSSAAGAPPRSSSAPAEERTPPVAAPEPAPHSSSARAEEPAPPPPQRLSLLESRACGAAEQEDVQARSAPPVLPGIDLGPGDPEKAT